MVSNNFCYFHLKKVVVVCFLFKTAEYNTTELSNLLYYESFCSSSILGIAVQPSEDEKANHGTKYCRVVGSNDVSTNINV